VLGLAPLMLHLDAMLMPELWLGPCSVYYLGHLGAYLIGPLGQLYFLDSLNFDPETYVLAQWGAAAGLAAFAIFYPLVFRKIFASVATYRRSHPRPAKNAGTWKGYALILLGLGVAIYYIGFQFGISRLVFTSYYTDVPIGKGTIFNAFWHTDIASIFLLAFCAGRNRGRWWALWLLAVGALALYTLLEGSRLEIALALVVSAGGLHLGGLSKRKIFLSGLIALALFVPAFGIVPAYRESFSGRRMSMEDRRGELLLSSNKFLAANRSLADLSRAPLERMRLETVDAIFAQTPKPLPYAGFKNMERVLYVWIPQFLWPGRPDLTDHNEIAIEYGVSVPGSTGSFTPPVGDGYRRFGWTGIVLLFAFIACCYGLAGGAIWAFRDHREALALLAVVTASGLETGMGTLLNTFYSMLFVFPKYLVFFWLLRILHDRFWGGPRRALSRQAYSHKLLAPGV